jgi:hypothetical protein
MCNTSKAIVTCYNKKLGICDRNGHMDMLKGSLVLYQQMARDV